MLCTNTGLVRGLALFPNIRAQLPVLGGGRSDGQHIIKLYCQGEHTHLLLAFFCDFNGTLQVWFSFFFIFTSWSLFDMKAGKSFLQYFPSRIDDYLWRLWSTMKHLPWVKAAPFLNNYPGNKITISVPKGMATHYRKLFLESECSGEMRGNRTEESEVISWLSYN